jgi:hypothetical protein
MHGTQIDWGELNEEIVHQRKMALLRNGSPDDWHRYADDHNWDLQLDGLYWIVSQPQCDRATATLIFWKGEPTGYDFEDYEGEMGEDVFAVEPLLKLIAERFNTTGYPRAEIAYDFLEAAGASADYEYAPMIKAGRLRDFEELADRGLHPDLMVLNLPGRKVGGFADNHEFHDRLRNSEEVSEDEIDAEAARRGLTVVR